MINLYLDDCRDAPNNNFVIARNAFDALIILKYCKIGILSLDHDLGVNQPTGYDLVKIMVEKRLYPQEIYLHSANPVGRENMYKLLEKYKPSFVKLYNCPFISNDELINNLNFANSRDFTQEEAERYEQALNKLYKPTGENFFDNLK